MEKLHRIVSAVQTRENLTNKAAEACSEEIRHITATFAQHHIPGDISVWETENIYDGLDGDNPDVIDTLNWSVSWDGERVMYKFESEAPVPLLGTNRETRIKARPVLQDLLDKVLEQIESHNGWLENQVGNK